MRPCSAPVGPVRGVSFVLQLGELYAFPTGDGSGQTAAVVELGGGYHDSDLQTAEPGDNALGDRRLSSRRYQSARRAGRYPSEAHPIPDAGRAGG